VNRTKLNYIVDVLMGIAFLLVFITGIFKMPAWTQYFDFVFRVIGPRLMMKIHDISGFVMGLLVLVHLILHWNWIVATTKLYLKRKK